MRYSANLNIIIKAIQRVSAYISRDYSELENLQSNEFSANKFTNSCYNKVKKVLAEDFAKIRPEYNMIFADGEKVTLNQNAEYSYLIFPVDGLDNLARANPNFAVGIALIHKGEAVSVAISKIFGGDLFYCEKGFGSYLNNRRVRVSKRMNSKSIILAGNPDKKLIEELKIKDFSNQNYGSKMLDIAFASCGKVEGAFLSKAEFKLFKPFSLIVKESGGRIVEGESSVFIGS